MDSIEKINEYIETIARDIVEHEDTFTEILALLKILCNKINKINNKEMRTTGLGVAILYLIKNTNTEPAHKVYMLEAIKQKYIQERLEETTKYTDKILKYINELNKNI